MATDTSKSMITPETVDDYTFYRSAKAGWVRFLITFILYPIHLFYFPIASIKYGKYKSVFSIVAKIALAFVVIGCLCGVAFPYSNTQVKKYEQSLRVEYDAKEIKVAEAEAALTYFNKLDTYLQEFENSINVVQQDIMILNNITAAEYEKDEYYKKFQNDFNSLTVIPYFSNIEANMKPYVASYTNTIYSIRQDYAISTALLTAVYNPVGKANSLKSFEDLEIILKSAMEKCSTEKFRLKYTWYQKTAEDQSGCDYEKQRAAIKSNYNTAVKEYVWSIVHDASMYSTLGCGVIVLALLLVLLIETFKLSNLKPCKELDQKLNSLGFGKRDFQVLDNYSRRQYYRAFTDYIKNKQRLMLADDTKQIEYNPFVDTYQRPPSQAPAYSQQAIPQYANGGQQQTFVNPAPQPAASYATAQAYTAPQRAQTPPPTTAPVVRRPSVEMLDMAGALLDPFYTKPISIGDVKVESICNIGFNGETYSMVRDVETGDILSIHIIKRGDRNSIEIVTNPDVRRSLEEKYYQMRSMSESERILNPNWKDYIIISGSNGSSIKFRQLFSCVVNGKKYCYLNPVMPGMEDSGILFEIGEMNINMISDMAMTQAVGNEYRKYAQSHTHMIKL